MVHAHRGRGGPPCPRKLRRVRQGDTIDYYGGSLANTSKFTLPGFDVALTYGGEAFRDKTDTVVQKFTATDDPDNAWFTGTSPAGERDVASGFTEAVFRHGGWLELRGLRYDHYALSGKGQVKTQDAEGEKCEDSELVRPDARHRLHADPRRGVLADLRGRPREGRLMPRASIAVTPLDGLQVYASYAQGFRPPTIAEMLIGGEHTGGIGVLFAPNPYLDPETSETFEVGANVKYNDVLRAGDTLRAKVAVYHTTIENYIVQGVALSPARRAAADRARLQHRCQLPRSVLSQGHRHGGVLRTPGQSMPAAPCRSSTPTTAARSARSVSARIRSRCRPMRRRAGSSRSSYRPI